MNTDDEWSPVVIFLLIWSASGVVPLALAFLYYVVVR